MPSHPRFVDEGSYGCVFRRAIPCPDKHVCAHTVGKVFTHEAPFQKERDAYVQQIKQGYGKIKGFPKFYGTCRLRPRDIDTSEREKCRKIAATADDGRQKLYQIILEDAGDDLDRIIRSPSFSLLEVVSFMAPVFRALHHLYTHEKVHMDIKPANLLYKTKHTGTSLKLADLGMMRDTSAVFVPENADVLSYPYVYYPPEFRYMGQLFRHGKPPSSSLVALDEPYRIQFERLFSSENTFFFFFLANILLIPDDLVRGFLFSNREARMQSTYDAFLTDRHKIKRKYIAPYLTSVAAGKIDVYMLGIALLEIITKYLLIHQDKLNTFQRWQKDDGFFTHVLTLIHHMIDPDIHQRWRIHDVTAFAEATGLSSLVDPACIDQLSVAQLRQLSKELGISLKSASKKTDMMTTLKTEINRIPLDMSGAEKKKRLASLCDGKRHK